MTPLEEQTINEILDNTHLSEDQKRKYVAALLLMTPKKQAEFAKLWSNFQHRCEATDRGDFRLSQKEAERLTPLFEGIKNRLFLKIKNNLA